MKLWQWVWWIGLVHGIHHDEIYHDNAYTRYLEGGHPFFVPLPCNVPLCNQGTKLWSELALDTSKTVVIPCGLCVTLDQNNLTLPKGVDVQGHLMINNKTSIQTPFIRVQGKLSMKVTRPVTDEPDIRVLLTNHAVSTDFIPQAPNQRVCSPCQVGSKPIVVAGGQLDIRGISDTCETWTVLHDVVGDQAPPSLPASSLVPARCPLILQQDMFDIDKGNWTSGGTTIRTPSGTLLVSNRKDAGDGPTWDLASVRDCLVPGQTYLWSARVRLIHATSSKTNCASHATSCLTLRSRVKSVDWQIAPRKGWETEAMDYWYNSWNDFYAAFTFTDQELEPSLFQMLQLVGPDPDVDIEIDNVTFSVAPTLPAPVCGGNLVLNGDARASPIHPYPMKTSGGRLSVVLANNGQRFFRVDRRTRDSDAISCLLVPTGCIVASAHYKIRASIRIQSTGPVVAKMFLRAAHRNGSVTRFVAAQCPPSHRSWVICESVFSMVQNYRSDDVDNIILSFETVGAPTANFDVRMWELEFVDGPKTSIIVPEKGIMGCWERGAEVLITSHTTNRLDSQVRRIVSSPTSVGNGFVKLNLDDTIVLPVTAKDGDGFAVEVALLSRNIVFDSVADATDHYLGGHLIVFQTADVAQVIQGVEVRNFGRQGELGRYPIHFHLCGSAEGSLVSKNSIRDSLQRCVVLHGSHNVTVEGNVAFNTSGHCFMVEDGGELYNRFIRNLGACTEPSVRLVRPVETDKVNPSTFWISNPYNEWIGNVAAGSRSSGFWLELPIEVRPPTSYMPLSKGMNPRRLPLKEFRDNVAHSNWNHGVRTYPHGFLPPTTAVFHNTRSYKNRMDGLFVRNSDNLLFNGGVLADNSINVDLEKSNNITLEDMSIIGLSNRFKSIVETQPGVMPHQDSAIGIELHSFRTEPNSVGAIFRNLSFSGFANTFSIYNAYIEIDSRESRGRFDFFAFLDRVRVDNDLTPIQFDFSKAVSKGITDIYLVDLDSSFRPRNSKARRSSSVVSDSHGLTMFIDTNLCTSFPERAYLYCESTCLRSITYVTDPAETEDIFLRIADLSDSSKSFLFPGHYFYEPESNADGSLDGLRLRSPRRYTFSLPKGNLYTAMFVTRNGTAAWPASVETVLEPSLCEASISLNDIRLIRPSPADGDCDNLIRNGELQYSTKFYPYWLHHRTGLELRPGKGPNGTNAISGQTGGASDGAIGQYLDTRCIKTGDQYLFRAWVKLERNGLLLECRGRECPTAHLRVRTPMDDHGQHVRETLITIASAIAPYDSIVGWGLLHGTVTMDARIAQGSSSVLYIQQNRKDATMQLANVSMALIEKDCSDIIFNGNFLDGSLFWEKDVFDSPAILSTIEVSNNPALIMTSRTTRSDTMQQIVKTGCLHQGTVYIVRARVRIIGRTGLLLACDPTALSGQTCPRMRLRSFRDVGLPTQVVETHRSIAETDHGVTSENWYTMSGVFSPSTTDELSEKSIIFFDQLPLDADFIVDDVSIEPRYLNCSEIILNGDARMDATPRFWRHHVTNDGMQLAVVMLGGNERAFKVSHRSKAADGLVQTVDHRCFASVLRWIVSARMKIVLSSTGQPISCDPTQTNVLYGCPPVKIACFVNGSSVDEKTFYTANKAPWGRADAFSVFEAEVMLPPLFSQCERVALSFRSFNLDWDLLITDISFRPAST